MVAEESRPNRLPEQTAGVFGMYWNVAITDDQSIESGHFCAVFATVQYALNDPSVKSNNSKHWQKRTNDY